MMTALLENEHPTFVLVFIIYVDPTRGQIETFRLCIPGVFAECIARSVKDADGHASGRCDL